MADTVLSKKQKLAFFRELLGCDVPIYSWTYGRQGDLIETNCEALVFHTIFAHTGCLDYAVRHAQVRTMPLILGAPLGMMWCAAIETQENGPVIHVLGPVLNNAMPLRAIEDSARALNVDLSWRSGFVEHIQSLPVINAVLLNQYVLQLHYCVTGEKLTRSEILYQQSELTVTAEKISQTPPDRYQTYMAEQALLRCVREGDLNYRAALARASSMSTGVRVTSDQPMMQVYISVATFIGMCVRAAIEGGLSPDTAYTVGDNYIQSMLTCKSVAETGALNHTMYEDFIRRVHRARTNPALSRPIQTCQEYIEMHPEEPLTLAVLAHQTGYSESYLCRRFKQETGVGVSNYIRFARIERARSLLTDTDLTVAEIAARLHFCSASHFSDTFRKVAGMLPQQYRRQHRGGE